MSLLSQLYQLVLHRTECQGGPLVGHPVDRPADALPEVPETLLDVTVIVHPEHLEPQGSPRRTTPDHESSLSQITLHTTRITGY